MPRPHIPSALRRLVVERAYGCCEYCLIPQTVGAGMHHLDHLIAVKHAGAAGVQTHRRLRQGLDAHPQHPRADPAGTCHPQRLAVEAGRAPAAITVLTYIAPAGRAGLQALVEAGADAAVVRLDGESEATALAHLEQIAQKVL